MNKLGIHTGLDLKDKDQHFLITHFGKSGQYFYDIVRGIDNRPVVSHRERKSLAVERTLEENLSAKEDIIQTCDVIIDKLVARLDKHKSYGRTLTLKIKRADFTIINRSKSLKTSYDSLDLIQAETMKLVEEHFDIFGEVRLIGLSISNFNSTEELDSDPQLRIDFEH
jgi:DNA polymerase-4